jgi:hypothetical protein
MAMLPGDRGPNGISKVKGLPLIMHARKRGPARTYSCPQGTNDE